MRVLFEGDGFLVVDKPAGLPTDPTRDPNRPSVLSVLRRELQLRDDELLAAPHRLDRDTSGVLVVARRSDALAALNHSLQAREWDKRYVAVVHGPIAEDELRLESFLACVGRRNGVDVQGSVRAGGKKAITLCRIRARHRHATLVECQLLTGRTHQVRVHLSEAGHPLFGDELYGAPRGEHARLGRHLLHAFRVELPSPGDPSNRIAVESAVPALFDRVLRGRPDASR